MSRGDVCLVRVRLGVVCPGGGGASRVCVSRAMVAYPPSRDMINRRSVHNILECTLVLIVVDRLRKWIVVIPSDKGSRVSFASRFNAS